VISDEPERAQGRAPLDDRLGQCLLRKAHI
jgi:hypothetical protein